MLGENTQPKTNYRYGPSPLNDISSFRLWTSMKNNDFGGVNDQKTVAAYTMYTRGAVTSLDVIVVTRRHVGGILRVPNFENQIKMRNLILLCQGYSQTVYFDR